MRLVYLAHFARGIDASSATDEDLLASLRARGHEVHVLSPYRDPEFGRIGGSVAVARLPRALLAIPGYLRAAVAALRLSKGADTCILAQYHVFQPATAVAFLVARLRDLPLVARAHNLLPGSYRNRWESLANGVLFRVYRRILRHRQTWVLVSGPEWKDSAVTELGLEATRVRILPDNVTPVPEPATNVQERLRSSLGLDRSAVVLKFGSHTQGGVATFVEAMLLLPGTVKGVVLADREWGEAYRKEAGRRGASACVLIFGPIPHIEVRTFLAIADACVGILSAHPMARGSIPRNTLEAMAAGRPVVLGRGIASSILTEEGKNCLLVRPDDARELAGALLRILQDATLARRLGAAARETIEQRFHSDSVAMQLESILAGLPTHARD